MCIRDRCQETAKGTGCQVMGVCGKNEEVANLQDLLIYATKGISEIVVTVSYTHLDVYKRQGIKW